MKHSSVALPNPISATATGRGNPRLQARLVAACGVAVDDPLARHLVDQRDRLLERVFRAGEVLAANRHADVFVRDGGTIGAMTSIEKVLKCPVLFLGLSLPEHGYHAPNENFDWQQASGGMVAFAKYFEEIANLPKR